MIEAALEDAGMDKAQVDWLVMHQANMRIMSSAAERLGVPPGACFLALFMYSCCCLALGWCMRVVSSAAEGL